MSNSSGSAPGPVTSEEFLQRSSSWTLACDNALLNRLKNFSENLSRQSQGILQNCDSLSTEINLLNSRVQTVTNDFLILSNTQFTENRVEEFQEMFTSVNPNPHSSQNVPVKTKAEKEAELIAKMKEAIKIGVAVKVEQQLKCESSNESISPNSIKLKLPHIIGTPKFFSSRYCGLMDELKLQPITTPDDDIVIPPDISITTDPASKSFDPTDSVSVPKNDDFRDIFFPSRELYVPPSSNQSLYKEGSPGSDDQFIHGGGTPSTTTSSNSNLGQDSEKKDVKPSSLMDELGAALRRPPPIIDDTSDDSDDGFRPMAPGKGLRNSIFGDVDDEEDLFGENSLFQSKQGGIDEGNDDLFSKKPTTTLNSLFGQPTRPTPVLLPSAPPPIFGSTQEEHNSTPPTLDDAFDSPTLRRENLDQPPVFSSKNELQGSSSDTLNKHFIQDPPQIPKQEEKPHPSETMTQAERVESTNATETRSMKDESSLPPSLSSKHEHPKVEAEVVEPKDVFTPKPGLNFVKSMAMGLKIDPMALNPSAKRSAHVRPPSQDSDSLSVQAHAADEESVPASPTKQIKIKPNLQEPVNNESVCLVPEIPVPLARNISLPQSERKFVDSIKLPKADIDPEEKIAGNFVSSAPATANTPQHSSERTITKSIFDGEESSDEDLFKPKSIPIRQSQQNPTPINSLFEEISPKIITLPGEQSKKVLPIGNPKTLSSVVHTKNDPKPKPKTPVQKSIFDDSESEDELFGFNQKSINTKKVPIQFSDNHKDDIFTTNYEPKPAHDKIEVNGNLVRSLDNVVKSPISGNATSNSVFLQVATRSSEAKVVPPTDYSESKVPLNRPVSPLFSANPFDTEDLPESSPAIQQDSTITQSKSKTKSGRNSLKSLTAKSIFGDSDSDDDSLFKSSSKNKTAAKGKSQTATSAVSALGPSKTSEETIVDTSIESCRAENSSTSKENIGIGSVDSNRINEGKPESLSGNAHINSESNFIESCLEPEFKSSTLPIDASSTVSKEVDAFQGDIVPDLAFDELVSANLLPNVAKNRAKPTSRSRRPPSRKVPSKEVVVEKETLGSAFQSTTGDEELENSE